MTLRLAAMLAAAAACGESDLAAEKPLPSRPIGIVRGWDVVCALRRDGTAMVACGLSRQAGDMTIRVSVGRSVIYSAHRPCGSLPNGHPVGLSRSGSITLDRGGMVMMKDDLDALAASAQPTCGARPTPSLALYDDLRTVLMMIRTFPPVPENRGPFLE